VGYHYWDAIVENLDLKHLSRFGSSIGYLIAPIAAVIMSLYRRRKTDAARKQWDAAARSEGVLREERGVRAKVVDGKGGGAFTADIRLTRNAFYILDTTGRRDPMRLMIHLDSVNELGLFDVEYAPAADGGGTFTVRVVGRATFGVRFMSAQSLAWWTDIRKALGLRAELRPTGDGAMESN